MVARSKQLAPVDLVEGVRRAREKVGEPIFEKMVTLRRDLHQHPELSWQEHRSQSRIREELSALGLEAQTIAGTGLIVEIPGLHPGPVIALRADMDALPIDEATGLSFSSQNPGVMHACGHDGHSSILLGAASLLMQRPPDLPVRLLFQPAEEVASGAAAMVEAGALDGVAMIFGGHVDRHYEPGLLIVTPGAVNASTDLFSIRIAGRQGHGARPHEALDAVVVGSLLVTALQTIVSREVDPAHPSVVTVGSFHAGTAANVIAGSAVLEGTIRAQDPQTRAHLSRSIERIASAIAQLHGAQIEVDIDHRTPPLINEALPLELAHQAAVEVVGLERVQELRGANMGGEDFACYLDQVPGCYIRYGAQVEGRESFPAHSSQFDIHEDCLATGAAWMDAVVRRAAAHILNNPDDNEPRQPDEAS